MADLDHRHRPSNPLLADRGARWPRRPPRQLGYRQCQRPQGRHQHRDQPDRHRDHQQVEGDHPRPGQCRRLGRRGQEGGGGRHPGLPGQCRDQPGRPRQGAARLQQRAGAAIGAQQWVESVGDKGKLRRALRQPCRQQRRHPLERLRDGADPVSGPRKVAREVANWDPDPGLQQDAVDAAGHPDIIGVISAMTRWRWGDRRGRRPANSPKVKVGGFDGSPTRWPRSRPARCSIPSCSRSRLLGRGGQAGRQLHQDRQDRGRHREAALRLRAGHQATMPTSSSRPSEIHGQAVARGRPTVPERAACRACSGSTAG